MATPPLLSLTDIRLTWGGDPVFDGVSLSVGDGDRIALVGRNGSGKSTLLKILGGAVQADAGERFHQPGAKVAYLPQEPDLTAYETLGDYAAGDLEPAERYKAEIAMEALETPMSASAASASGGEKRRAALARTLADEPDLLLLDEPTNHLDIRAIAWLEETLSALRAGFVLISHDRAFLTKLTRATLWIDRGVVRRLDQGFGAFEAWRDQVFDEEDQARRKLDAKIRREEHWIVHGVSGRRKRNVRRVAELEALKETRRTASGRPDAAAMALDSGQRAGKIAIEAKGAAKRFGDREIFSGFDIKIERTDRIAIVGPNGAGKSTLIKVLTGELEPDAGVIKLGANLEMAVFDQTRSALDESKSLWETLTDDKALGVKGSHDQIMVRGRPKHVVGYLKEFLFNEAQARGPVSALSGGERARLLLAKIMARPSNLLVLDEPTNDLDVETLDLLQETLADYDGALLLVSHDRDFIDRTATKTIVMPGDAKAVVYAGGWSDYMAQARTAGALNEWAEPAARAAGAARKDASKSAVAPAPKDGGSKRADTPKLSFQQRKRLEALPAEIEKLEDDLSKLEGVLATPGLYEKAPEKFNQATALFADRRAKLDNAEAEWLELEELRERLESDA